MVKEEIVEGIRQAISKGESIEKAMMSFYNSGYLKEDIEQAAAAAQQQGFVQQAPAGKQVSPGVVQRVSAYGNPEGKTNHGKAITIVLIIILVLLLGVLGAVILYKDPLASFLGGIF